MGHEDPRTTAIYTQLTETVQQDATDTVNAIANNIPSPLKGLPALQYLSRYLYRGVISQKNITGNHNGKITFRYKDSQTQQTATRTLAGEDFIWKLLTHVLPRRFRRVRDYGFLHHNAKKKLLFIQYLLGVKIDQQAEPKKTSVLCELCRHATRIIDINPKRIPINFRFMMPKRAKE